MLRFDQVLQDQWYEFYWKIDERRHVYADRNQWAQVEPMEPLAHSVNREYLL